MKKVNKIKSKKYDLIFSMGVACPCTDLLRSLKLQEWSYPFDWVFGSDLNGRCNILLNDFDGWFEKADFVMLEPTSVSCHSVWINKKTQIIYNHDFQENSCDINESYQAVRSKYNRRCNRLLGKLKKVRRIAIVWIDRPDKKNPTASPEEILQCYSRIVEKYSDKRYLDLYYVHHEADVAQPQIKELKTGVFYITLDYHARGAEDWAVDLYRLQPVFAGVILHRPIFVRVRSIFNRIWHK